MFAANILSSPGGRRRILAVLPVEKGVRVIFPFLLHHFAGGNAKGTLAPYTFAEVLADAGIDHSSSRCAAAARPNSLCRRRFQARRANVRRRCDGVRGLGSLL